jgi:vancomycin resistance protein YoaR
MPERQASPGEVTSRPHADATENGNGTGPGQAARPGGNTQPATEDSTFVQAASVTAASDEHVADSGEHQGTAEGNGVPAVDGAEGSGGSSTAEQITRPNQAPGPVTNAPTPNGQAPNGQAPNGQAPNGAGNGTPNGAAAGGARPSPSPRPSPGPRPEPASDGPTVRTPVGEPASGESPTVRTVGEKPSPQQGVALQQAPEMPTTAVRTPTPVGAPARRPQPAQSWFTSVDAEDTQVLPRMPAATQTAVQHPAPPEDPATEVIPVTRAARPAPPPLPPNDEPTGTDGGGRRPPKRALLVLSAVVGTLGLLYVGDLLLGAGSVPRGVTVAGVAVGGLPFAEAEQRLRTEVDPRLARPIPVTVGDATSEIDPVAAGLRVDWGATVAAAGEQPLNPITRLTSFFTERPVGVVTTADADALNAALEELSPVVDREPVEGTVRFEGVQPQPVDPVPGQQLDVAAAVDVLQRDWANGGAVALPLTVLPATTTPEDVRTAIEEVARPAVSAPVTFVGEKDVRGTLAPEVIATALVFRAENGALVPELNQQIVQDALAPQMAPSEKPGRDATIDFSSGRPVIVPSQDGRGVDYAASLGQLLAVLTSPSPREITAVYADQPAEVTTQDLESLGNPQIIGDFTTGGFAPDSGLNIRRAAELINGVIVQPGETFSLDDATGPRNAANGYVEAGVIDNGAPSRGIAGGVSQVSTTLYNAAYFAGMTLIEHKAHSFYISRYPAGREATIATGAIDNRWRNDNPTPVLIRTEWTPRSVNVKIYGQRQFEVTGSFGPRTNPTQPNTVSIPPGKPCNPSNGAPGFTITDTRTLRNVSTGESRSETITTRYNPVPRVVCG